MSFLVFQSFFEFFRVFQSFFEFFRVFPSNCRSVCMVTRMASNLEKLCSFT